MWNGLRVTAEYARIDAATKPTIRVTAMTRGKTVSRESTSSFTNLILPGSPRFPVGAPRVDRFGTQWRFQSLFAGPIRL